MKDVWHFDWAPETALPAPGCNRNRAAHVTTDIRDVTCQHYQLKIIQMTTRWFKKPKRKKRGQAT